MTTYPSLTLYPAPQRLYQILCAAGSSGVAQSIIAERLGRKHDGNTRRAITYSAFAVRSALEPHGFTLSVKRVARCHTHYAIVPMDGETGGPVEDVDPAVSADIEIVGGIASYRHRIGPEFDGCGAVVRLRWLSCMASEVRP